MALGAQDKFDPVDVTYSMVLAVPEAILSKAVIDPVSNSVKSQLSSAISEGAVSSLSAKERGQIVKDVMKQLRKESGNEISKKDARIAAEKIVNMMESSESSMIRVGVKVADQGVQVSGVIVGNVVNDTNKEMIKQQEKKDN